MYVYGKKTQTHFNLPAMTGTIILPSSASINDNWQIEEAGNKSSSSRGVSRRLFFFRCFCYRARRRQLVEVFLGMGYAMIPDAGAWRLWVSVFFGFAFFF